ncbi:MAG TPA: hypothetical protein VIR26_09680 [Metalysinibacillus sp.]
MEKYTINYQNGFTSEFLGTLEEAKLEALDGMSYTQASVSIEKDGEVVTTSRWYGVEPTQEDYDNNAVLEEIGGGFYGDWE